jgi:hypothetical protein
VNLRHSGWIVIPTKVGNQNWIPASAGMTDKPDACLGLRFGVRWDDHTIGVMPFGKNFRQMLYMAITLALESNSQGHASLHHVLSQGCGNFLLTRQKWRSVYKFELGIAAHVQPGVIDPEPERKRA